MSPEAAPPTTKRFTAAMTKDGRAKTSDPKMKSVHRKALIGTSAALLSLAAGVAFYFCRFNHRLVIVNKSGQMTTSLQVTVNRLTMVAAPLQPGETRSWYESQEWQRIAPQGTISIVGKLDDGRPIDTTLRYDIGDAFWNNESRVIVDGSGGLTFEP